MKQTLVVGALAIAIALAYGQVRYKQGVKQADHIITQERNKLLEVQLNEIARLEYEKYEAEREFYELKDETVRELDSARSVADRLRQQVDDARSRQRSEGSCRADGTGADWIGGFAACVTEYESLGEDCARTADKLRGLQGFQNRIQR